MGIAGSTQKRGRLSTRARQESQAVVNTSKGRSVAKKHGQSFELTKQADTGINERSAMGARAVKAQNENHEQTIGGDSVAFEPVVADSGQLTEEMSSREQHFQEWRIQMSKVVERLQMEAKQKDLKIAELSKQAKEASDRYEMATRPTMDGENCEDSLVETLKSQLRKLQARLNEKEDVIRSLQRQLMQSRNDKESQVSVVKDTVEMVIREKDSEIRRLRALWSPNNQPPPIEEDDLSEELVSRATKLLNVREITPDAKNTRFGISAENRSSKSVHVQAVPKTPGQILQIRKALNTNVFLKGLDNKQVQQLIDSMSHQTVTKGSHVIIEGEFGNHLYVLESGQVEVFHTKGSQHVHVVDLNPGTVFGELAILYNCKRTASVTAKTDASLWSLDRKIFQSLVKRSGQQKREEYVRLLKTVDKLNSLSDNKLLRIADCVEETQFHGGEYIIRQGDVGDSFYIIQDGRVKVTQNQEAPGKSKSIKEELICYLGTGEYFGERALMTEDKRAANVVAESEVVVLLMLDRLAFNSLLGTLTDFARSPSHPSITPIDDSGLTAVDGSVRGALGSLTEEDGPEEDEEYVLQEPTEKVVRITITTRPSKGTEAIIRDTKLKDLKILSILGQGGFGCVKLVQVPGVTNGAFALKSIRKAKILKTGQQQHVLAEKNILLSIKSPFIGRLFRTFKDEFRVYMLMEAYLGGEVYNLLKRKGTMDEAGARFCSGCVLEALAHLHERGIVYRDLKPENLMVDHKGYVKLVDFGFAKRIRIGFKTWTFCGTPEYFPPEILGNIGHDIAADYWSFGILIYEFLTRSTPFYASDDMTVYENILGGIEGVKFSRRVHRSAELLIRALCKLEPRDRLGYQKGGVNDIRKHRWYHGFDWQGLRAQRITSPIKPNVKSPTDTKNFERCVEDLGDEEEDREILESSTYAWDESF